MSDYPGVRFHGPTITPQSRESIGLGLRTQTVSAAWPSANRALYVPFFINAPWLCKSLFWCNGATVAGNVDAAICAYDSTRIVSTGSTAQSGANAIQNVALGSPLLLTPGSYLMALSLSSATATIVRGAPGVFACVAMGMFQNASAFPVPTFALGAAAISSSYAPVFGLASGAVI